MPDEEYFAIDALSASDLKKVKSSLSDYQVYKQSPPKKSAAMSLGTLTHLRVLEGQEAVNKALRERFCVLTKDIEGAPINPKTGELYGRSTKAFNTWYEENGNGKEILIEEDFEKLNGMLEGISRNEYACRWLSQDGDSEVVIQDEYETEVEGTSVIIPRKIKADRLLKNKKAIIDLKTADSIDRRSFVSSVYKWGYHIQQLHYLSVAQSEFPELDVFIFIVIQNKPPYNCAVYSLDTLPVAQFGYEKLCSDFAKGRVNNNFNVGPFDNQQEPEIITIGEI